MGAPTVLAAVPPPPFVNVQFTSVTAKTAPQKNVAVAWTAVGESSVRAFQVWGTSLAKGALRQNSGDILPANSSHSVKCAVTGDGFVQIHAVMVDGSVQTSNTVKVRE